MEKKKPPKPVRMSRPSTKQRIVFWVGIGLAVGLILIGWIITFNQVIRHEVSQLRTQIDSSIEKAADTFTDFSKTVDPPVEEELEQFKDNLDIFYQAVEEEKEKQKTETEAKLESQILTE